MRGAANQRKMLSRVWKTWLAENLLQGVNECVIVDFLLAQGFEESSIRSTMRSTKKNAVFAAASGITKKLRKLEAFASIKRRLSALSNESALARLSGISRGEFKRRFYSKNLPVIMTDIVPKWPAFSKWNPEYLADRWGKAVVNVSVNRKPGFEYQLNIVKNSVQMKLRDYCALVKRSKITNEHYMVANNHALESAGLRGLMRDIKNPRKFLDAKEKDGRMFLWFGPAGTVTPLHHDAMNIVMAQIYGRKKVTLIPPDDTPLLYNDIGVYSPVDIEQPDFGSFPLLRHARVVEIILYPGDLFFIPVGWWHHVRSLSTSIGVSFTNFVFPNDFEQEWQGTTD